MSRLDDLPADRRAVLQLLLRQGKGYDELADLLRVDAGAVRERALDALALLGPTPGEDGHDLDPADRAEVGDYLLGQQAASARAATRALLEGSPDGRAWARAVVGELRAGGLADDGLPEVPAEGAEVEEAFGALQARREAQRRHGRRSRLGGALLGLAALALAALVVALVSGGDDDPSGAATTAGATTGARAPEVPVARAALRAPSGSASAAVQLVRQDGALALVFRGEGIARHGTSSVYAIWLAGAGDVPPRRLGFVARQADEDGTLRFVGPLPAGVEVDRYDRVLMTRETTEDPARPGTALLSGALVAAGR